MDLDRQYLKAFGGLNFKGGKIRMDDLGRFINNSYMRKDKSGKDLAKEQNIDGYEYDPSLSSRENAVYYNKDKNHVVNALRGTQADEKGFDWGNNMVYALSPKAYLRTSRYKRAEQNQLNVEKKYANAKKSIVTHSQSGIQGRYLAKTRPETEVISLNPASSYKDNSNDTPNIYTIRSNADVVSAFHKTKPQDITIPMKNPLDIVGEHDYTVLKRLPQEKEIGFGRPRSKYLIPLL